MVSLLKDKNSRNWKTLRTGMIKPPRVMLPRPVLSNSSNLFSSKNRTNTKLSSQKVLKLTEPRTPFFKTMLVTMNLIRLISLHRLSSTLASVTWIPLKLPPRPPLTICACSSRVHPTESGLDARPFLLETNPSHLPPPFFKNSSKLTTYTETWEREFSVSLDSTLTPRLKTDISANRKSTMLRDIKISHLSRKFPQRRNIPDSSPCKDLNSSDFVLLTILQERVSICLY